MCVGLKKNKGTNYHYLLSLCQSILRKDVIVRSALGGPASLNHCFPWHTSAYLLFFLVYSLHQTFTFFLWEKTVMRYIVSKFCEGCFQTKLFLAGEIFFQISVLILLYPHLRYKNRCGHWWFGFQSCVWISVVQDEKRYLTVKSCASFLFRRANPLGFCEKTEVKQLNFVES